jgi:hypothetical protein
LLKYVLIITPVKYSTVVGIIKHSMSIKDELFVFSEMNIKKDIAKPYIGLKGPFKNPSY